MFKEKQYYIEFKKWYVEDISYIISKIRWTKIDYVCSYGIDMSYAKISTIYPIEILIWKINVFKYLNRKANRKSKRTIEFKSYFKQ